MKPVAVTIAVLLVALVTVMKDITAYSCYISFHDDIKSV